MVKKNPVLLTYLYKTGLANLHDDSHWEAGPSNEVTKIEKHVNVCAVAH